MAGSAPAAAGQLPSRHSRAAGHIRLPALPAKAAPRQAGPHWGRCMARAAPPQSPRNGTAAARPPCGLRGAGQGDMGSGRAGLWGCASRPSVAERQRRRRCTPSMDPHPLPPPFALSLPVVHASPHRTLRPRTLQSHTLYSHTLLDPTAGGARRSEAARRPAAPTWVALVRAAPVPLHPLQLRRHTKADAHARQGPGGGRQGGGYRAACVCGGAAVKSRQQAAAAATHEPPSSNAPPGSAAPATRTLGRPSAHLCRPGARVAGRASRASTRHRTSRLPSACTAGGRGGGRRVLGGWPGVLLRGGPCVAPAAPARLPGLCNSCTAASAAAPAYTQRTGAPRSALP